MTANMYAFPSLSAAATRAAGKGRPLTCREPSRNCHCQPHHLHPRTSDHKHEGEEEVQHPRVPDDLHFVTECNLDTILCPLEMVHLTSGVTATNDSLLLDFWVQNCICECSTKTDSKQLHRSTWPTYCCGQWSLMLLPVLSLHAGSEEKENPTTRNRKVCEDALSLVLPVSRESTPLYCGVFMP
jgi:hypothetical protein